MREKTKYNLPVNQAGQKIIEERATNLAQYIIDSKDTVRGAAKKFCISKSTVHTDVGELQFFKIPRFIVLPTGLARCGEPRVKLAVKV